MLKKDLNDLHCHIIDAVHSVFQEGDVTPIVKMVVHVMKIMKNSDQQGLLGEPDLVLKEIQVIIITRITRTVQMEMEMMYVFTLIKYFD